MFREPGEDRDSMPLGLLQRRGGGGGGSGRRKGNLSVCKPMKGMNSKGELQYLPMETSWTYCLADHQLLF